jgi:hypothetical protein
MKRAFAFLLAGVLATIPARAETTIKNWEKILDQAITISSVTGFSVNRDAHSAQLTGVGSAMLDNGASWVNPGTRLTVNFTNTDDMVFQSCAEGLAAAIGLGAYLSGHGFFSFAMMNGKVEQATITLESMTACNSGAGQQRQEQYQDQQQ